MLPLLPFQAGPAGNVIAPFVEGNVFATDFFMEDRVGATAGTPVLRYLTVVGRTPSSGMPAHMKVVTPEGYETPADLGWIDGSGYRWLPERDDLGNAQAWIAAGCPRADQWADMGVPPEFLVYARMHITERAAKYPDGSPKQLAKRAAGVPGQNPGRKRRAK